MFGWEFGNSGMPGMDYRMARTGEQSGAAVYGPETDTGHAKYYLATDDIRASIATVREFGGSAGEPSPVPTHGWCAACSDSEGNAFHLWQADSNAGQ